MAASKERVSRPPGSVISAGSRCKERRVCSLPWGDELDGCSQAEGNRLPASRSERRWPFTGLPRSAFRPGQRSPRTCTRPTRAETPPTLASAFFAPWTLQARRASVNFTRGSNDHFFIRGDFHEIHLGPQELVCLHLRANRPPISATGRPSVPCSHRGCTVSPSAAPTPSALSPLWRSQPALALPVHGSVTAARRVQPAVLRTRPGR
jgi:hypothetical protein